MDKSQTQLHTFKGRSDRISKYSTAISLHSHTMYSREYLGRLPKYIAKVPIGHFILEREIGRLHMYEGRIFDFNKFFWTPPLSPKEAFSLEKKQIEENLGMKGFVSLTDHDNIEAGLHLRMLQGTEDPPVSVEWTVPYEQTMFHLGIHNLPPAKAVTWMREFKAFTAKADVNRLEELLSGLAAEPSALIVLNHPYWDAQSIGPEAHSHMLHQFIAKFKSYLHALELNGMRSRRENRDVMSLGEELDMPVVSGGDRHGCEPNAVLNLSRAESFEEFVFEIREGHNSEIALMPQYFEPLGLRLLEGTWHTLADAPGEFGREHWMTRVFIEEDGVDIPLSQFNGTRFHRIIDKFRWILALSASPVLRPALRLPFRGNEEGGL